MFFRDSSNTTTREYMIACALQADLIEAAAKRGYHLQVYLPAVDRDGFDIIFGDGDSMVPIQLKSTIGTAKTWDIHRSLFRPPYNLGSR